jgi:[ribosomal protein S18]-alanine N-acetyltransferase
MRRPSDPLPAPGGLVLRRAGKQDVDRVVEIEREGFAHPWSRELVERELDHPWSRLLLAEDGAGGRVVGYIVFWIVHDEVHVLNVAAAVDARRRGVGRALMCAAEEEGRVRGARLSTLEVRKSNEAAIALYGLLGYRRIGVRPNYYAEEREDAIVMLKQL